MLTTTFTIERHIEELRAELRATTDAKEACDIQSELAAMLRLAGDLDPESEATI